ncbi:nitric oxide synthase oxygenase [Streptomyces purpurogeneiscleroticus]|uniref:nitric oxide synthase oxygenase n=1 Tax=Streptomyces purpurogeneiscleroticus TaxID=68259 RepID=UPI001CBAC1B6|nr:nitric oxide synthase oxygenase [Streptomyces purpurogeneiscleroticus]MBZ4016626.1 nitric oxide synthase oxygenase [Streptomyces purpurogeneiscleroticus]
MAQAQEFIRQFHAERPEQGDPELRLRQVRAEIDRAGTYTHTTAELEFGARVAWRNAARCIGRFYWRSLVVRDMRRLTTPQEIAEGCWGHLRQAHNGGRIHPTLTVFAPDRPGRPGARLLNQQIASYAGHCRSDGTCVGESRNADLTGLAKRWGWAPPGGGREGRFDILPLMVQTAPEARPHLFDVPTDAVREVSLVHPDFAWFGELGLRWYTIIAICNQDLEVGGITYPAAPQNGWFVGTTIGRPLTDTDRYNLLPEVAGRMGLDTSRDDTLWKDRAAVEINLAVLHSFHAAGVSVTDHHTEARRFLAHVAREHAAGRPVPADWSWIVPPISGSTTPVFHRYYDPVAPALRPAFLHREPWPTYF